MNAILKKAYHRVVEDEKFVKLSIFSLFPYSLLFVLYLVDQVYFVLTSVKYGVNWNEMKLYIQNVFSFGKHNFMLFSVVVICIVIIYYLIPPVSEAALIEYLNKKRTITSAIGKGLIKFFPMFELHGFLSLFSFLFFFIVVSRLYILNMLNPYFVLPLLIVWLIFIIFFSFSTVYAKYLIVIDNLSPFEALKHSINLSLINFSLTLKGYLIYIFLYIRVIFNVIILVGIPLLVLYLFLKSSISNVVLIRYTIYCVMLVLFLVVAYVNGLIDAFFISMWYEIFKSIEK